MAEHQIHFRRADGGLGMRTVAGETEKPALPEGAVPLTKAAYTKALAEMERGREEHRVSVRAQDGAQVRADYEALIALKMPEATARRLSGYAGEAAP